MLSFAEVDLGGIVGFNGLKNYLELFSDKLFWLALKNTLQYTLTYIIVGLFLSLFFAVLLNRNIRFINKNIYRAMFFFPVITSEVAVSLVWRQLYDKNYGFLNRLLEPFGLAQDWLGNPNIALWAITALCIWQGLGYYIILFLSGLQAIPEYLYEAAEIDGAGPLKSFFKITLPLLAPSMVLIFILAGISCFQVFTPMKLITGGGPMNSTMTIGLLIYNQGFEYFERGIASTTSYILFAIVLVFSILQKKVINKLLGQEE